jgi:hypothetical protein
MQPDTAAWDKTLGKYVFQATGYCPVCEADSVFRAEHDKELPEIWHLNWFRGSLFCTRCASIPRMRALAETLRRFFPEWRKLRIHESSPGRTALSPKLRAECPGYIATQYDTSLPPGSLSAKGDYRSEDLEDQTFDDASFDLVITQDVFEHLMHPDRAIREIARTLAPGGAHVMTVPLMNQLAPSRRRAKRSHDEIIHLLPPMYHGNPIDPEGSLVTVDWGYDIIEYLAYNSGMSISMVIIDDMTRGIRAALNEVIICRKLAAPPAL